MTEADLANMGQIQAGSCCSEGSRHLAKKKVARWVFAKGQGGFDKDKDQTGCWEHGKTYSKYEHIIAKCPKYVFSVKNTLL